MIFNDNWVKGFWSWKDDVRPRVVRPMEVDSARVGINWGIWKWGWAVGSLELKIAPKVVLVAEISRPIAVKYRNFYKTSLLSICTCEPDLPRYSSRPARSVLVGAPRCLLLEGLSYKPAWLHTGSLNRIASCIRQQTVTQARFSSPDIIFRTKILSWSLFSKICGMVP